MKAKRVLPCRVCGLAVELGKLRLRELVRLDALPFCRANGCFRYAHMIEGSSGTVIKTIKTVKKARKKSSYQGPLEHYVARHCGDSVCDAGGGKG